MPPAPPWQALPPHQTLPALFSIQVQPFSICSFQMLTTSIAATRDARFAETMPTADPRSTFSPTRATPYLSPPNVALINNPSRHPPPLLRTTPMVLPQRATHLPAGELTPIV